MVDQSGPGKLLADFRIHRDQQGPAGTSRDQQGPEWTSGLPITKVTVLRRRGVAMAAAEQALLNKLLISYYKLLNKLL